MRKIRIGTGAARNRSVEDAPSRRLAHPAGIASVHACLARDAASCVDGTVIELADGPTI